MSQSKELKEYELLNPMIGGNIFTDVKDKLSSVVGSVTSGAKKIIEKGDDAFHSATHSVESEVKKMENGVKVQAHNAMEAVQHIWQKISSYFAGSVKNTPITVGTVNQKGGEIVDLHHFVVSEKQEGGGHLLKTKIKKLDVNLSEAQKTKFIKKVNKMKKKYARKLARQNGGSDTFVPDRKRYGKKHRYVSDDSSDSSDSSDEYIDLSRYRRRISPISYWLYTPSLYDVTTVSIPVFKAPLIPRVSIYQFTI